MKLNFKPSILLFLVALTLTCSSQNIGINTTGVNADPSSALDIVSSNKGLLVPRVALTALNSPLPVTAPLASLLVYNTATSGAFPNNVVPGYYYWDGTKWVSLSGAISGGLNWSLLGNSGTNATTNFIGTTDANDLVFKTNNSEKMRVLNGGNVGVGTSNPASILHVYGGATTSEITLSRASSFPTYSQWRYNGTAVEFGTFSNDDVSFFTNNIVRMTVKPTTGNVGIGTNVPSSKLHVTGEVFATSGFGDIVYVGGDNAGNDCEIGLYAPAGRNIISFFNRTLSSYVNIIAADVTSTNGNFILSDNRYKKNISEIENPLANLNKLHGVTYYMKTDGFKSKGFSTKKQIGVIAQELELVYPELVNTDAEGFKSVDYSKLTPIIIEAVKELDFKYQNKNSELSEANTKLQTQLTDLKDSNRELQTQIKELKKIVDVLTNKKD